MDRAAQRKLVQFCEESRAIDDSLGRYSDHEGDENGPTYSLFLQPVDAYLDHAEHVIELCRRKVRLMNKLRNLKIRAAAQHGHQKFCDGTERARIRELHIKPFVPMPPARQGA